MKQKTGIALQKQLTAMFEIIEADIDRNTICFNCREDFDTIYALLQKVRSVIVQMSLCKKDGY